MEVDRIPHMGGALREEDPPWQKPGKRRPVLTGSGAESEAEREAGGDEPQDGGAPEAAPEEQPRDGALDVEA